MTKGEVVGFALMMVVGAVAGWLLGSSW